MTVVLGIDPGASGGLAFFNVERGLLDVFDMPIVSVKRGGKNKREVSAQMLQSIIGARRVHNAFVEKVGAMPGQGVSSMFQFGRSVGMVEGVLATLLIPTSYVTPQVWQKEVGARGGKDASRARAAELFPAYAANFQRKKDDGRADAALIAWFGAQQ